MGEGATPFPFVVGVGRSGTTLLRSILNAHPELAVANESRFPVWMADHRARYDAGSAQSGEYGPERPAQSGEYSGFDTGRFLADLLDNPRVPSRLPDWGLSAESIRARVAEAEPLDLSGALRVIYLLYAEHHGKPRYGDKTPRFVQHVDVVAELFPEAKIVHLVRDGRDVALAVGDVDFGAANLTHAAYRWARRVERAETVGTRLGPTRYCRVRYEDLTNGPEPLVEDLCRFLALEYHPQMLRFYENPDAVFAGLGPQAHHENLRRPVTTGLRDWRRQMPPGDVVRFEAVAGDVLAGLGYETTSDVTGAHRRRSGMGTRLKVARGRAVAFGRARRRARGRGRNQRE